VWRKGLSLPPLQCFQQGVEGAGGGGGGGDVAGAVASGLSGIHAEPPAGGGGMVGRDRLDGEHDFDFVARVESGKREQSAVHAAEAPVGGFVGILQGQGSH
jgi:hypothetical protein